MVLGLPPAASVPCWSQAAVNGAALTSRLSAAQIAAIDGRLPKLWPPGAYALGSAAARAVRACLHGARTPMTLFISLDGEMKMRNLVAALPVRLAPGGVVEVIEPDLSPHDRVRLMAVEG
jgi:malate/lactate dehydrogenase